MKWEPGTSPRATGPVNVKNGSAAVTTPLFFILLVAGAILYFSPGEATAVAANAALLAFLTLKRPSFLPTLYAAYVALTFLLPTVLRWIMGDYSNEFDARDYTPALAYLFVFNAVLVTCLIALTRRTTATLLNVDRATALAAPITGTVGAFVISIAATGILAALGQFRVLEAGEQTPILGLLKAASELGIVPLLILGIRSLFDRKTVAVYAVAAVIGLVLAFASGSRWYLLQVVLLVAMIEGRRAPILVPWMLLSSGPFLLFIFPFMLSFRTSGYSVAVALEQWQAFGPSWFVSFDALFADRFNYVQIVQRTMDSAHNVGTNARPYFDNVIGLIPRIVWPDKPNMGLDLNRVARELQLIDPSNLNTAIGLSIVGESHYLLKEAGIIIAAFQASIFAMIERLRNSHSLVWRSSYIAMTFVIIVRDSFLYIVPLLITNFLLLFLLAWMLKSSRSPSRRR